MEVLTESARATQKLGEKFAADLISGKLSSRVICLYGDLGSGKTTFIQGLARGLGIKKRVLSPTFIIMRQYPLTINHESSIINFFHIDLYRIEKVEDTRGLGLEEIWSDTGNIVAIEWPEKIEKILPKKRIEIHFEYVGENGRKIKIND